MRAHVGGTVTEYLATFGYCMVSALLPFVNAEAYLVAVAAVTHPPNVWLLAAVAAVGQMLGKLVYYGAGRGGRRLPQLLQREQAPGRWATRLRHWQDRAARHPVYAVALMLVSAFIGLPPFAAVSVLVGVIRLPVWAFVLTGTVGRYARFAACLAAPSIWRLLAH